MADSKPRPSSIVGKPATVQDCKDDYRKGAAVRAASEKRDARKRR
ncbi:hypothetical protein AB0910_12490 [Streptomyces sp. NPDC047002]|uniref:Uncharacterized protein n=1 Tax=Streptomyces tremellae TaxID=1124239 RepID=A0ABP7G5N8_9ACTN